MSARLTKICATAGIAFFTVSGCTSITESTAVDGVVEIAPRLLMKDLKEEGLRSVFVRYKADAPANVAEAAFRSDVRSVNVIPSRRRLILEVSASHLDATVKALQSEEWVESVEIGSDASRLAGGSLPSHESALMSQTTPWGVDTAGATYVHSTGGFTGYGVKVAVLDAGISCGHPDLTGRAVSGYDFVYGSSSGACSELIPHGTAVAGIIGADDDASGVIGMAPEVDLYSVRICDDTGYCTDARVANGLYWAGDNGMDVVNLSIANCGGDLPVAIEEALEDALANDIVVVVSAGNGAHDPVCYDYSPVSSYSSVAGVITVGGYFYGDTVGVGYQFGSAIDIVAPAYVFSDSGSSSYAMFKHTSAAVPHVSGAAALLLESGVAPADVRAELTGSARDGGASGKDNYFGYGMLDVIEALIPGPQVQSISHCTAGVIYAGNCLVTPIRHWGVPQFQWKFEVTYSNSSHSPIDTGWASDTTYLVPVPAGEYAITVKMWTRERPGYSPRNRTSILNTYYLQVCPAEENLLAICPGV